ncbi:MAG: hypothetical protein M1830_008949 [Pleopsidium flavum]|nr:MAG: hypothetical protein M1830_008949 [Pleopsidium flavum]
MATISVTGPIDKGLHVHRTGHWLPQDHTVVRHWLGKLVKHVDENPKDLDPVLQGFCDLVEGDKTLQTLSSQMFEEVPMKPPYNKDPTGLQPQVRDFNHMLALVNHIMKRAPEWNDDANKVGLIGFPINAILDWPMGTVSGGAFFLRQDVNQRWAKILNTWAEYLASEGSASVLDDSPGGWFGTDAMDALTTKGNVGKTDYTFDQLYVCDKNATHHGFKSWDDFFIRSFKSGIRPLAAPEGGPPDPSIPDPTAVIVNACESTPIRLENQVQAHDAFWLKGQPYSIVEMLATDELASQFVGGTVYQAFLSALSYHRWHSPVSGTVVKAYVEPGTYYSENYFQGFANPDGTPDPAAPDHSQAYIAEVATRGLIFIQADNPDIGLMCIVFIGMCEVSTCDIQVRPWQHIMKGDDIGTFHFGGSTHCLLFRKGVDVAFEPFEIDAANNTPVLSTLAVVRPSTEMK